MKRHIIIFGSSRSYGNTRKVVTEILDGSDMPLVDLRTLNITPYDYEHLNKDDDFIPLMERVVEFDVIVLATPVYWYTMSAIMKTFVDRITDLLEIRKDLGRKLRGKQLFVISSVSKDKPEGFELTFSQTCNYLGIEYLGTSFICNMGPEPELQEKNSKEIAKARAALGLQAPSGHRPRVM